MFLSLLIEFQCLAPIAAPRGRSGFDGWLSDLETKNHKEKGKMVIS